MKFDRNFILAMVLSLGVFLAWDYLYEGPQREAQRIALEQEQAQQVELGATADKSVAAGASNADIPSDGTARLPFGKNPFCTSITKSALFSSMSYPPNISQMSY